MTKEIGRLRYKRVIVVFKGLFTFNIRKVLKRRRVKVISYLFDFLKPHNGCRKPNKKRK